jgi:3-hydroxyisobutyrate dehydrogenase-like beta-hydroxyacid dehydrogenase
MKEKVGILHPGEMGVSVAASALKSGCSVYWAAEARSQRTRERAERYALTDTSSLAKLCETCSVIISVCPPHAAEEVGNRVLACSFKGLYVDANAISPQRVIRIGEAMAEGGASFVDGGIIGGPAWEADTTCLYLSGREADRVAACFSAGPLETKVIGDPIGKASALKMCYAAYTKGTTALLCAILGAGEGLGVREELESQWSRNGSDFAVQARQRVRGSTTKAWRFAGEMEEIRATLEQAGLPGGFHAAAAEIYRRIAHFKGSAAIPPLKEVLVALLRGGGVDEEIKKEEKKEKGEFNEGTEN